MATAQRPIGHFTSNEHAPSWGDPRRCVYGFHPQPAPTSVMVVPGSSLSQQQRSLLSERLHSNLKDVLVAHAAHRGHDGASSDEDCFEDDGTDEGCTFGEEDESWSWLDAQEHNHSCLSKESDRSSHTSQPIAIPASCYFKDEVQRQALEKLNQKRKWYQQQLEAERMMARSMAKSRQAAAAARGNKPSGRSGAPA